MFSKKLSCCILSNLKLIPFQTRSFYEQYRQGDKKYVPPKNDKGFFETARYGMSFLKEEIEMWNDEVKEKFMMDPKIYEHGDTEVIWKFNNKEVIDKWKTLADSDHNEGYSDCTFELTKNSTGLFHGRLDTKLPQDGTIVKTGYCNINSERAMKSFMRDSFYDWTDFSHLLLRVRGDGRSYAINLLTEGYFDVTWHDMYSFVLYTRGGPYWQTAKLPFSRFVLSSKGRIQDKQWPIPLSSVTSVGITCSDRKTGPFQLEIDYIGVHLDCNHREEFAYEQYQLEKFEIF